MSQKYDHDALVYEDLGYIPEPKGSGANHIFRGSDGGKIKPRSTFELTAGPFSGRFRVVDRDTGLAVVGQEVRVSSASSGDICEQTDQEGYTSWVSCESVDLLKISLNDEVEL